MKISPFSRRGGFLIAPLLLCAGACAQNAVAPAAPPTTTTPPTTATPPVSTVIIDPKVQFQEFQGWGTSLAWWAHVVGQFPEPARTDYLDKAFSLDKGLGLNIVRYNIGGGENPQYLAPNKQFLEYRAAVPAFLKVDGSYDWTADAGQRHVLREAMKRGANLLEAFSNSPPYFMTRSGSVTGQRDNLPEGLDNIKPESDAAFAAYLAEVTRHFRDEWKVNFDSLEPLNEPSGTWWKFGNHQEGAFVERPHQNAIVNATISALRMRGLSTPVAASDESVIDDAARTFPFYDARALAGMNRINTHSYGGSARAQVSALALGANKDLWLSEYGDGDASGMQTARRITEDIRGLHPSAWCYWQVVDNADGWGFLKNPLTGAVTTAYTVNKKFHVMGQYSRFIRPGARFIAVNDRDTLAALNAQTGTLVLVALNDRDAPAPVVYDLSGFASLAAQARVIRTDATHDAATLPDIALQGKTLRVQNPPHSVTTYVINARFSSALSFDPQRFYTLQNARDHRLLQINTDTLDDFQPVSVGAPALKTPVSPRQQWRLVGLGGGVFELVNRVDGLALEIGGASLLEGASANVYHDKAEEPTRSNQHWRLQRQRDGTYKIVNTLSGLNLSATATGVVQQNASTTNAAQAWRIAVVAR